MANEPSWEDLFNPATGDFPAENQATARQADTSVGTISTPVSPDVHVPAGAVAPPTRRELRESEGRRRKPEPAVKEPRRRRGRGWLIFLIILLVIGGLGAGATAYVWANYENQVRKVLGWELPNDFVGTGNGEEVVIVIQSGEIGSDVARTLAAAGVTMTFNAFYYLLLAQETPVSFVPGTFSLQKEMSAQAALDALMDPANKITNRVRVPEGAIVRDILENVSISLEVPVEELQAIADDYVALGVPAEALSIEGYLFPATYTLEPNMSPRDVVQMMVNRMIRSLNDAGVAEADRHRVVTAASLIQREAGTAEDFFKVSRVIQNRLDRGMLLQFDSTSHYGAQSSGSVWTSDKERADDNPWNTYVRPGLPAGPIAAPSDLAIEAALNPAEGTWVYFVAIDLRTGESAFTNTLAEHQRAVDQLRAWCRASEENGAYCK